ncbi:MAG: hypothetical protein NTV70_09825 [Acidobacteria bacterium]|nr:hypothetical protein [Acidobacteriota bacterium]
MKLLKLAPALLATSLFCHAQPLSFTRLPASGAAPSARLDGTIAYDPQTRQLYLFGGQGAGLLNDTWSYSLEAQRWTEVATTGTRPPARLGQTLIFDPVRRRLIVFGGQASGFFSDVWALDVATQAWQQLSRDEAGPSRRYGHSAVYDSVRDRMVISHGFTNAGRFDDTWAFEFATNSWRNISPSGTRPLRRCLHHAVYDPGRDQMFLYGGCASGFGPCPLGDLWAFDFRTGQWSERTGGVKPPARQHYGIVFDTVRDRLLLFGGGGSTILNDTWDFDPRTGGWAATPLTGAPPSARARHQGAFVADRGAAFFFGGQTAGDLTSELWMLAPPELMRPRFTALDIANAFTGDRGPASGPTSAAPGELISIYGRGLGPAEGVKAEFHAITGLLPVRLGDPGVSVTWNDIPAPLLYVRFDQINLQVPYELQRAASASVVVTVEGRSSDPVTVAIAATRPGLFPRVWNQDGTVNGPANAARAGEVVTLYATGQGVTVPESRTGGYPRDGYPEPAALTEVTIGGVPATVEFRGQAPGTAGVMQINVRVPPGLAPGIATVILTVGGAASRTTVAVL